PSTALSSLRSCAAHGFQTSMSIADVPPKRALPNYPSQDFHRRRQESIANSPSGRSAASAACSPPSARRRSGEKGGEPSLFYLPVLDDRLLYAADALRPARIACNLLQHFFRPRLG